MSQSILLRIASCTAVAGAVACAEAATAPAVRTPAAPRAEAATRSHTPLHILEGVREMHRLDGGSRRGGVAPLP